MAFQGAGWRCPHWTHREALYVNALQVHGLVGGSHHHTPGVQVLADQPLHQGNGIHVQSGERLVQHPERALLDKQAGQRGAAALAGRQSRQRYVLIAVEPGRLERSLDGIWSTGLSQGDDAETIYAIQWQDAYGLRILRDVVGRLGWQRFEAPVLAAPEPRYPADELLGLMPRDGRKPVDMREVLTALYRQSGVAA